jgi:hypothetical protein
MKRALVLLAACGPPPPLVVEFQLVPPTGATQTCLVGTHVATTCQDVPLRCDATLSIRIIAPDDPKVPYVSLCAPIVQRKDLCEITGILLPQPTRAIPSRTLQVEVAIYPTSLLCTDPMTGNVICPTDVQYDDTTGLPVLAVVPCEPSDMACRCSPSPAIGGSTYYHPGDRATVVTLGCTDLTKLEDPTCSGPPSTLSVSATVEDFGVEVSVDPTLADQLTVSVGEPQPVVGMATEYVLNPTSTRALPRTIVQPIPTWGADVDLMLQSSACLDVLEDVAQATASLACVPYTPGTPSVELVGYRLAKPTLDQILAALRLTSFPSQGLVVGIVLDYFGNPAVGYEVRPPLGSPATVEYLSADRTAIIAGMTSMNGIFLSRDAPYLTTFQTHNMAGQVATGYGGLVDGKVTIAVVQFTQPPNM